MAYQQHHVSLPSNRDPFSHSAPVSTAPSPLFQANFQHALVSSRSLQQLRMIDWQPQTFAVNQPYQNHPFIPKIEESGGQPFSFPCFIPSRPDWQPTHNNPPMMINGYPTGFQLGVPPFHQPSQDYSMQGNLPQPMSEHPRWTQQRNMRMPSTRYTAERVGYYNEGQLLLPPTTFRPPHPTGSDSVSMSMVNPSSLTSAPSDGQWQPTSIHAPDSPAHRSNGELVAWSGNVFGGSGSSPSDYDIVSIAGDGELSAEEEHSGNNALSLQLSRTHSITSAYSTRSVADTYASSITSSPGQLSIGRNSCCQHVVPPEAAIEDNFATIRPKRVVKPRAASSTVTTRRRKAPNMHIPPPIIEIGLTKKTRGRHATTDPELIEANVVHVCPIATRGACFRRREHVKRHVRGIHTDEKPFRCTWRGCTKDFSRRDNLKAHYKSTHKAEPPLILIPHYRQASE